MLSASIQKIRIDLVRVLSARGAREGTVEANVFRRRISERVELFMGKTSAEHLAPDRKIAVWNLV